MVRLLDLHFACAAGDAEDLCSCQLWLPLPVQVARAYRRGRLLLRRSLQSRVSLVPCIGDDIVLLEAVYLRCDCRRHKKWRAGDRRDHAKDGRAEATNFCV